VSDLVTLERSNGALPVPAESAMPDIDVTVEALPYPAHGYTRLIGMRLGARELTLERVNEALAAKGVFVHTMTAHEEGKYLHVHIVLDDESAMTAVIDRRRFTATMHTYPYDDESAPRVSHALEVLLKRQGKDHFFPYADQFTAMLPVVDGSARTQSKPTS
jgi:hypothetical protein